MRKSILMLVIISVSVATAACKTRRPGQCRADSDCKTGEKCINSQCKHCGDKSHCPPGKTCINGECKKEVGYCDHDRECPGGKVCKDHLCQACSEDRQCQSGRCVNGSCAEVMSGTCKVDDDCKDEEICKEGRCTAAHGAYSGPALCAMTKIHFDFNKAEIRKEDLKALQENVKCIQSVSQRKIQLIGHCDPRGTEEYNLALSEKRAQTVKRYLESLGILPERLLVIPKGELEATGENEESYLQDRKVEFVWYEK